MHGLGYDAQGNLQNKDGTQYAFDYGNRLRKATYNTATVEAYQYDGYGRRVLATSAAGAIASFYSQGGQLLYQDNGRDGKTHSYFYLSGSLVNEVTRDTTTGTAANRFQHTDALGSPVAVTNGPRTVLERREYEPYGRQLTPVPADGPGYTGHVYDAATELNYMQQRYYDPEIGRFDSVDAVTALQGGPQHFNSYDYAYNNPYKFTDPDGRCPECAGFVIGAGFELLVQGVEIAAGARTELDGTDIVISGVAGATGVGAAKLIGRAASFGRAAKFLANRAADAVVSASAQYGKDGEVDPGDLAIDVIGGGAAGKIAGARAARNAAESATGRVLERQANRAQRIAAKSSRNARQQNAAAARTAVDGHVEAAELRSGAIGSNALSAVGDVLTCTSTGNNKEC